MIVIASVFKSLNLHNTFISILQMRKLKQRGYLPLYTQLVSGKEDPSPRWPCSSAPCFCQLTYGNYAWEQPELNPAVIKTTECGVIQIRVQIPVLAHTVGVTFNKFINLFEPWAPHLKNGENIPRTRWSIKSSKQLYMLHQNIIENEIK